MQIFHWLFKLGKGQGREASSTSHDSTLTNQRTCSKETIPSRATRGSKHGQQRNARNKKSFGPLRLLRRGDAAEACFCGTLSLRRLSSFNSRRRSRRCELMTKIKQEEISRRFGISPKTDSNTNKVLPVTEASVPNSATNREDGKEKVKNEQNKTKATISRMKELIRWAAAAKSDKAGKFMSPKVLHFRSRETPRRRPPKDDSELSSESPKISLRWDAESCSTLSSICSEISVSSSLRDRTVSVSSTPQHCCNTRRGNWITTDSEFVVLEL